MCEYVHLHKLPNPYWSIAEQDDTQLVLDAWRHRQVLDRRSVSTQGPQGLGSLNVALNALAADMVKDHSNGARGFNMQGTPYGKSVRSPTYPLSSSPQSTSIGLSDSHLGSLSGMSVTPSSHLSRPTSYDYKPVLELSERRRNTIKAAFRRIDIKGQGAVSMQDLSLGLRQFSQLSTADQQRLCNGICGTGVQQVAPVLQQITFGQFCLYYKSLGTHIEHDCDFEDLLRFHWGFAEVSDLLDDMKNKFARIGMVYTFRHTLESNGTQELPFESFQGALQMAGMTYTSHDVRRVYDSFKMADFGPVQGLDISKLTTQITAAARPRTPIPGSGGMPSLANTPNLSTTSLHTVSAGYQSGSPNGAGRPGASQPASWTLHLSSAAGNVQRLPEPAPAPPETAELLEHHENPHAPMPMAPPEDDDEGCLAPDENAAHPRLGYAPPPAAPPEDHDDVAAPLESRSVGDEEEIQAPSECPSGRLGGTSLHHPLPGRVENLSSGGSVMRFPEPVPAPPETPELSEHDNPNAPPPVAPEEENDEGHIAPEEKVPNTRLGFAPPPEAPPEDQDDMACPFEHRNPQDDEAQEAPAEKAHGHQNLPHTYHPAAMSHQPTSAIRPHGQPHPNTGLMYQPTAPKYAGGHLAAAQAAGNTHWNGEKRAVTVGINYLNLPLGQGCLSGCINDSDTFITLLTQEFGYKLTDIRQLRDDQQQRMPTRKNIIAALTWLVTGAKSGDHLFFHYSGHGTQQRDTTGIEMDGLDECLVPCDFREKGMLSDNELRQRLVMPLPEGVRLTVILDCCHSGTALDLPYKASLHADGATVALKAKSSDRRPPAAAAEVVMLAGCEDSQTSADIGAGLAGNKGAAGAMTTAFKAVISHHATASYHDLMIGVRSFLKSRGFAQVPQLCSEHFLNLTECFMPEVEPRYQHPPASLRPPARRALTIGINYYEALLPGRGRLPGCINDSLTMVDVLKDVYGFQHSQIRQLTDDHAGLMPTKANILNSMLWLTQGAGNGDEMFLHYSGHGSQQRDRSGDENDGKDETLVPCDFQSSGQISDDELHAALVANLPKGCRLWAIFDCCHSGTALDLQYRVVVSPDGKSTHFSKTISSRSQASTQAEVIMISGCMDSQTSAGIGSGMMGVAMPCGAMTTAFAHCVNQQITCEDLLRNMRSFLQVNRFPQVPQMTSEQFIQLDTSFVHYQMKRRRKQELPPSLASRSPAPFQTAVSPPISPAMPSMPASPVLSPQPPMAGQMTADDYMMIQRMDVLENQIRTLQQQGLLPKSPDQTSFPPQYAGWA